MWDSLLFHISKIQTERVNSVFTDYLRFLNSMIECPHLAVSGDIILGLIWLQKSSLFRSKFVIPECFLYILKTSFSNKSFCVHRSWLVLYKHLHFIIRHVDKKKTTKESYSNKLNRKYLYKYFPKTIGKKFVSSKYNY